ncbi:1-methylthio-D-xylulose 5-phosphate methylsulfurylase [uncultured Gammaproteobacteria bacterium]
MDQQDHNFAAGFRAFLSGFDWEGVTRMPYKEDGSAPFKAISRQVLFADAELGCELRYFEIAADGYSTLERHQHMHGVMIVRGAGLCLLGQSVRQVAAFDLVTIRPWIWHQFRATEGQSLGFLCMVNAARDKPQLPSADDLAGLRSVPEVAAFLDYGGTTVGNQGPRDPWPHLVTAG